MIIVCCYLHSQEVASVHDSWTDAGEEGRPEDFEGPTHLILVNTLSPPLQTLTCK